MRGAHGPGAMSGAAGRDGHELPRPALDPRE